MQIAQEVGGAQAALSPPDHFARKVFDTPGVDSPDAGRSVEFHDSGNQAALSCRLVGQNLPESKSVRDPFYLNAYLRGFFSNIIEIPINQALQCLLIFGWQLINTDRCEINSCFIQLAELDIQMPIATCLIEQVTAKLLAIPVHEAVLLLLQWAYLLQKSAGSDATNSAADYLAWMITFANLVKRQAILTPVNLQSNIKAKLRLIPVKEPMVLTNASRQSFPVHLDFAELYLRELQRH
mmetsp:Transcript_152124/g.276693  ORF Transcript_152124/g.276693 Transcript_152124/m.276693 type:complete len:238 (+) Transcript_152124:186-899(+)